jgi:hypothetical protein
LYGFSSRPTQDIDLLGSRIPRDEAYLRKILFGILSIPAEGGLLFHADAIDFSNMSRETEYQGKRIRGPCSLGSMKTNLKLDIVFEDSIFLAPIIMDYPEILGKQVSRFLHIQWNRL